MSSLASCSDVIRFWDIGGGGGGGGPRLELRKTTNVAAAATNSCCWNHNGTCLSAADARTPLLLSCCRCSHEVCIFSLTRKKSLPVPSIFLGS